MWQILSFMKFKIISGWRELRNYLKRDCLMLVLIGMVVRILRVLEMVMKMGIEIKIAMEMRNKLMDYNKKQMHKTQIQIFILIAYIQIQTIQTSKETTLI